MPDESEQCIGITSIPDESEPQILIIDDDEILLGAIGQYFSKKGRACITASDAAEALKLLHQYPFHLIISDISMPGMDGIQFMKRAKKIYPHLDFIMMTGYCADYSYVDIIKAGANDYMAKPFSMEEVMAKIERIERERKLFKEIQNTNSRLTSAITQIKSDLKVAADIQQSLLPKGAPDIDGVAFAWIYEPCETVGGDIFNIYRLDEHHIGMYVLDVMGHGLSAAMFSVSLSRVLTPYPQQGGILKTVDGAGASPPYYNIVPPCDVVSQLNRHFPAIGENDQFFTFIYGILDIRTGILRYSSAGHPDPIHITQEAASVTNGNKGIPVGIDSNAQYKESEIRLQKNNALIFYTDGILIVSDRKNEQLNLNRILCALSEKPSGGVEASVQTIRRQIEAFDPDHRIKDDVTILGVQLK